MKFNIVQKVLIILILQIVILAFSSCHKNASTNTIKPKSLIEKSKISEILTDVFMVESVLYFKLQKGIDMNLYTTVYYNALFKKYGINKKQLLESLKYYIETDNEVTELFLTSINKLMTMQKTAVLPTNSNRSGDTVSVNKRRRLF